MSDDIEITENDFNVALEGLKLQLKQRGLDKVIDTERFIDAFTFEGFLKNTASVIAHERAFNRELMKALNSGVSDEPES